MDGRPIRLQVIHLALAEPRQVKMMEKVVAPILAADRVDRSGDFL